MSSILHTRRLTLRPVTAADIPALFAIFRDARAVRYMPTPPHESVEETGMWLEQERAKAGAHYWGVCLKGNTQKGGAQSLIGYVHFVGESQLPGMGIVIHPDHWGRCYAPEACRAALDYGFVQFEYQQIEVWIDERNHASRRVAQKLGLRVLGQLIHMYSHQSEPHSVLTYGITAGEWHRMATTGERPVPRVLSAEPLVAQPG